MRIILTKWFRGFARREDITDASLKALASEIENGIHGASLGGGVYKYRLPRQGKGKSGGYRVIVCMQRGDKLFLVYGFAKSVRDNLSNQDVRTYKNFAEYLFSLDDARLAYAMAEGRLAEI